MRNGRATLTTVLRRVGEFNTSLIARLKLPKKSIITRSRHEKDEKKTFLNPQLGSLPGRVKIVIAILLTKQTSQTPPSPPLNPNPYTKLK